MLKEEALPYFFMYTFVLLPTLFLSNFEYEFIDNTNNTINIIFSTTNARFILLAFFF